MITRRNCIWFIPLILLLTFPFWKHPVSSFLRPPGSYEPDLTKKKKAQLNFFMQDVTIKQAENGKETANIVGTVARSSKIPNQFILDDINGDIINDEGAVTHIVAKTGNYDQEAEKLVLHEHVTITNRAEKYTLTSEHMIYDGKNCTVISPHKADLRGDGYTVHGSQFQHNMKTGVYTVIGDVHCSIARNQVSR